MLIPLKALPAAKSRLGAGLDPAQHVRVVEAIRADTLSAARAAASVARVVVVTDQPGVFDSDAVFVQETAGLNNGLAEAARDAARRWPDDGIAAMVGDLPALRSAELDATLQLAADHRRSFVPDAPGTGTTLLAVTPGTDLSPQFGAGSAGRHRNCAHEIKAGPSLRADVDTAEDLEAAGNLGFGARTRAVIGAGDQKEDMPRSSSPGMMSP